MWSRCSQVNYKSNVAPSRYIFSRAKNLTSSGLCRSDGASSTSLCARGAATMPAGVTPTWEYWDPESSANAFRGKEIMIAPPMQLETATTTYRKNYPLHPVWVRHQEKVNHLNRPVPSYPMTTSSREFYKEHKNAVPPMSAAAKYPQPMFAPKFSVSTTSRDTMGKPNDDAYQRPQSAFGRPPPFKPNNAPLGTTTQRADFLEWKPQAKHPHHGEGPHPTKPTKFQSETTSRETFRPPPPQPPAAPAHERPPYKVTPAGPEYTTTYRQAYEIIPLPKGIVGGIGLQVMALDCP